MVGRQMVWRVGVLPAAGVMALTACGKSSSTSSVQGLVGTAALTSATAAPTSTGAGAATPDAGATPSTARQATGAASPKASPTHRKSASAKASAPVAATPTGSVKACPGSDVSAMISGVHKCLQAGQECQSKAVAQYPAYGFDCVQSGTRWVLKKHA